MKANCSACYPAAASALLLLGACVAPEVTQVPIRATPHNTVVAPATLPTSTDWHDMPITAGTWRWAREGGASVARFSSPQQVALLSLACDAQAGAITLALAGPAGPGSSLSIYTTSLSRTLAIRADPAGAIAATLPAHDPLLDAMAFSRGRFAIAAPGLAPLYLPSWPEVGRVIEDCR